VLSVGVAETGGVLGRTVVVAAVVVVVIVAISVAVCCCSWRRAVMLTQYWSGDRDLRYWVLVEVSLFGGVGGLLIFS
jgi:hypothetical protein